MKVELPEFKRCCCCIPLRHGLLAMAYIKLILMLLVAVYVGYVVTGTVYFILLIGSPVIGHAVIAVMSSLLPLLDIAFTIVFIVGGHKRSVKLLQIYYVYSMAFFCFFTIYLVIFTAFEIYMRTLYEQYVKETPNHVTMSFALLVHGAVITALTNIGIQVYIILLIRSEIYKLRNNCQFKFINAANEAQCAMEIEIDKQANENDIESGTNVPKNAIISGHEDDTHAHENETQAQGIGTHAHENRTHAHENSTHVHEYGTHVQGNGTHAHVNGTYDHENKTNE